MHVVPFLCPTERVIDRAQYISGAIRRKTGRFVQRVGFEIRGSSITTSKWEKLVVERIQSDGSLFEFFLGNEEIGR